MLSGTATMRLVNNSTQHNCNTNKLNSTEEESIQVVVAGEMTVGNLEQCTYGEADTRFFFTTCWTLSEMCGFPYLHVLFKHILQS